MGIYKSMGQSGADRSNDGAPGSPARDARQDSPRDGGDQLLMPAKPAHATDQQQLNTNVTERRLSVLVEVPAGSEEAARLIALELRRSHSIANLVLIEIEPRQDLAKSKVTACLGECDPRGDRDEMLRVIERVLSFSKAFARKLGISSGDVILGRQRSPEAKRKLPDIAGCLSVRLEVPPGSEDAARLAALGLRDAHPIVDRLRVEIEPKQNLATSTLTVCLSEPDASIDGDGLERALGQVMSFSAALAGKLGIPSYQVDTGRQLLLDPNGKLPDKVAGCQGIATQRPDSVL